MQLVLSANSPMRGISCRPTPGRRYATWQAQIVTTLGVVLYNGLQNLLLQRYILFYDHEKS